MLQKKDMNNIEIAELLRNVAASYQIKDSEKFKFNIIAYERAADAIEHLSSEAKDLYNEGKLDEIPGVGESISKHLSEIFVKGESVHFNKILKTIPEAVFEILPLEGIGPKLSYRLVNELKISSPNAILKLKSLALNNKIAQLPGFGEESQKGILKAINAYKGKTKRFLLNYAESISDLIVSWMKKEKGILRIDTLGSLRRKDSTIGDIDIACSTNNKASALKHFLNYPNLVQILEKGEAKASIKIPGNIQVDMRFQDPNSYGSLLQHFTGSKHHNIALREYATSLSPRLSLSEYGIRILNDKNMETIKDNKKTKLIKFKSEEDFYHYLRMEWIPPEIREDNDEIDAAIRQAKGEKPGLPKLIELSEIKGDLQVHSNYDIETSHDLGLSSLDEITQKAEALNYEYVALTDHNPSHSKHTPLQILDILKRRKELIDKYNYSYKNKHSNRVLRLFNCLEIDILSSGILPIPDKAFEILDFALVSIHSGFRMGRNILTKRVIDALKQPKVKIFAHPTARKLNDREGVELDWEKIFNFCKNNGKWIEINGDPMRLDLPDYLVKEAVKYGVKLTIGTDAHHIDHMDNVKYAVYVARRGWAEKSNLVNTLSLKEIENLLE